ncbi:MAG TPA: cytochrome c oxidase subunit 3 [Vicinamibacterales bacterium]
MTSKTIDVSGLPSYAFGHRSLMWWGGAALMLMEGAMFALFIVAYLYLKGRSPEWPPGYFAPVLFWGTLNTALLLLSAIPNQKAKAAAQHLDLQGLRIWLGVSLVFGAAFLTIRVFEFGALNVWWDSNAYGSVVWTLLGFHTVHLLTDVLDSIVLMVLLFTGPLQESHFTDAAENALYWDFVVISWLPVYACIYLAPRLA